MKPYTMRILGLTGRMKSGKDTCYEILKKQLAPLPVVRLGFADALKDDICKFVGVKRDFIEQHKNNFRLLMQAYGTDVRRQLFGDDYWILRFAQTLEAYINADVPPYLVVIPDVRFQNEANFIKQLSGKIWRVKRSDIPSPAEHVSEVELLSIQEDEIIDNGNSLISLEHEITLAWMRTYRKNTQSHV